MHEHLSNYTLTQYHQVDCTDPWTIKGVLKNILSSSNNSDLGHGIFFPIPHNQGYIAQDRVDKSRYFKYKKVIIFFSGHPIDRLSFISHHRYISALVKWVSCVSIPCVPIIGFPYKIGLMGNKRQLAIIAKQKVNGRL